MFADGQRVRVHKNLHRSAPGSCCWSVLARARGRVTHTSGITLVDCRMHVNPAAQERIAAGEPRSVHAWIWGTVTSETVLECPVRLTYTPQLQARFYVVGSGELIDAADVVAFTPAGCFIDEGFNT